ncbi:MAG TPA: DUF4340 domain-containing protein [Planctomycetota bacterium]|nr:DUF4340 domain-containing protein [Planctomycetota bacterium]
MSVSRELRSRLLTLLVLVAGAFALLVWAYRADVLSRPRPVTGALYPGLDVSAVDWLHLGLRGGHDLELQRETAGFWWIVQPAREYARQQRIDVILDNLARAQVEPVDEAQGKVVDADVGLSPPANVIAFRVGGRTETLSLGAVEPLGRMLYARRSGDDRVVLVTRNLVTLLQDTSDEFVDHALLRGLAGHVTHVAIEGPQGRMRADHTGSAWALQAPGPVLADDDRLDQLVRSLQFVQQDSVLQARPTPDSLHAAGLPNAEDIARGDLRGATHVEVGALGQQPAGAYLAAGWQDQVGLVAAVRDDFAKSLNVPRDALNLVGNPPDWFREHRLLPPVRERAESLRLESGGATLLDIRRGTAGRWSFAEPQRLAGSEVESERLEGHSLLGDFFGRIDELQVRGFTDPPTGEPWGSLLVGWTQAGRLRQDRVDLYQVDGRVLAVTTQRPSEGLELPPEVLDLFTPLQPELLRSLRPLDVDSARWASLVIELPGGGPPLEIHREPPDGPWSGDDEWTRRTAVGTDMLRGLRGLRWQPARPGAQHGWRVVFAAADGSPLAEVRLRRPEQDEPLEVFGLPCALATVSGHDGVELVVHREWVDRLDELAGPLVRKP